MVSHCHLTAYCNDQNELKKPEKNKENGWWLRTFKLITNHNFVTKPYKIVGHIEIRIFYLVDFRTGRSFPTSAGRM